MDLNQIFSHGLALHQQGRLAEAEPYYREVLRHHPNHAEALHLLGVMAYQRADSATAIELIRKAIALAPGQPFFYNNLGEALRAIDRHEEAIQCYRKAIEHMPGYPEAHNNLGAASRSLGRLSDAVSAYERAIQLKPDYPEPYSNLGAILTERGKVREGMAYYRKAVELRPDFPEVQSNILLNWNYHEDAEEPRVFAEHCAYGATLEQRYAPMLPPAARAKRERIRIGFVSGDFRRHSVAYFIEPFFASADRSRFELFAYHNHRTTDEVTRRFMDLADGWRAAVGLSDQELARQIRADEIDILVDLSGHTAKSRLPVFAMKPAPVQAAMLGYPNTTGLRRVEYRIADPIVDAGEVARFFTEKLIPMRGSAWCYRPFEGAPEPEARSHSQGVVFGCFNNLPKVGPGLIRLWCAILDRVPGSRMVMKSQMLGDPGLQRELRDRFGEQGIAPDRVGFLGFEPKVLEHFRTFNAIDIALDTYPYNGTTTTCDALWMGVPVVALVGSVHRSRVSLGLLSRVGLTELLAKTPEEYAAIAVNLANDRPRLLEMRSTLRERMRASPLMDTASYARDLGDAFEALHRG